MHELLQKRLIGETLSLCVVPVVLAPKKNGEWRMFTDSRAINKIIVKYRFPMPRMDDIMDFLSGAKYFTKIDLKSGYHHIRIREGDDWPTPENLGEVRSFHGLASFYRKFIRNSSFFCNAMTETMRGDKKEFKWTRGADKSFETLKQQVVELHGLALPNFKKVFQVECDTSGNVIGAILSQEALQYLGSQHKLNQRHMKWVEYF